MTSTLFSIITHWQDSVFTQATPLSCAKHLKEEVKELTESIERGELDTAEVADCFMLLIGVCNTAGMTYDDIIKCLYEKHQINLQRKWGQPNEQGYVKHIPD